MDESGYCDTISQHSNTANDDPTITVTVEPVDVLVEKDGSVLLSNLQSALPGAHGLYYYQFGHKKAVKYDSQSAKISPPSDGWGARSYFVTLAHGCKTSWTAFGSYENASKQFERSVKLVQKMMGGGGNVEVEKRERATTKGEVGSCARCRADTIIPDLDQDEDKTQHQEGESSSSEKVFRLKTTIDDLNKTLAAKEHEVQLLKEENHELRSQNITPSDSDRSVLREKSRPSSTDFSGQVDEGAEWYYDAARKEKESELQLRIDDLLQQLDDNKSLLNNVVELSKEERQRLEGETAEVRQQFHDAKWRVGELEAALSASNADAAYKNERVNQLESELGDVSNQLHEAHQKHSELERQLSSKQNEIDELAAKGDSLIQMSESVMINNSELVERVSQLERELADLRVSQESPVTAEYNRPQESSANDDQESVEDLKQQLVELRDSYNQLEQERTVGRKKSDWELGEANQWLIDARWRIGELEEDVRRKSDHLDEKDRAIDRLNEQLQEATKDLDEYKRKLGDLENKYSEMNSKKDYVEQELSAAKKQLANTAHSQTHEKSNQDDMLELSDELMKINLRKYELENHAAQLASDLKAARQRADYLESIQQENAKNLWHSGERLSELEREQHRLLHELSEANRVIDQLRHELSQQDSRIAQERPDEQHLREELRAARESLSAMAASETDARQKAEWRLGEVTQAWNDAKWKIGELEAGEAHKQWELDQARFRVHELEQVLEKLQNFKSKATKVLEGSFLIRKQPYVDRAKWSLSMWDENSPAEGDPYYRRVWFDIDAPNARNVYLMGSFVNWECGLMCTATEENGNRKGVWVDLPAGRYEFRFLVDGQWRTAGDFHTCPNDFGSENNWRVVD